MDIVRAKPFVHLTTFTMETHGDRTKTFDEQIHEFVHRIHRSSNRTQAVAVRTMALTFIDEWRLQRIEQLDQRVRSAGQLILDAFDGHHVNRHHVTCPHGIKSAQSLVFEFNKEELPMTPDNPSMKNGDLLPLSAQSIVTIGPVSRSPSSTRIDLLDDDRLQEPKRKIEILVDRFTRINDKTSFDFADFGRDFAFEPLAHLPSSSSNDTSMVICNKDIFIYSQHGNELVVLPVDTPQNKRVRRLDSFCVIRDLCYIAWLGKCLVVTDNQLFLFSYRTTQCDLIETSIGYVCAATDNRRRILYLIRQSTLYKYDEHSLTNFIEDQYPIADGYRPRRLALDNKTDEQLALLVTVDDGKNFILVYSTMTLADGYLYKIIIDDRIERQWICSDSNDGWLIRGTFPGSCFHLNTIGLGSVRIFDDDELKNIVPMNSNTEDDDNIPQRFVVRTNTEIFVLGKYPLVQLF